MAADEMYTEEEHYDDQEAMTMEDQGMVQEEVPADLGFDAAPGGNDFSAFDDAF